MHLLSPLSSSPMVDCVARSCTLLTSLSMSPPTIHRPRGSGPSPTSWRELCHVGSRGALAVFPSPLACHASSLSECGVRSTSKRGRVCRRRETSAQHESPMMSFIGGSLPRHPTVISMMCAFFSKSGPLIAVSSPCMHELLGLVVAAAVGARRQRSRSPPNLHCSPRTAAPRGTPAVHTRAASPDSRACVRHCTPTRPTFPARRRSHHNPLELAASRHCGPVGSSRHRPPDTQLAKCVLIRVFLFTLWLRGSTSILFISSTSSGRLFCGRGTT
mmetsp:Transcript_76313/g.247546  ORF Transcript_76313/g.247546 Transcript_76313/m.247546 type:complete len:273 (-) Transcript_76313:2479-3297(-)